MEYEGFRKDKQVDLTINYRAQGINATMDTIVPMHIFIEIMQLAQMQRHHIVKTYYSRWANFDNPKRNLKSGLSRVKYQRNRKIYFKDHITPSCREIN